MASNSSSLQQSRVEVRQLLSQLGSVQAKLATKTEALLRVGADLEESSQEGRKLSAQCNNFERNLRRTEEELAQANKTIEEMRQLFALEKNEMSGRNDRLQIRSQTLEAENSALRNEVRELKKDCKTYRQKFAKMELARSSVQTEHGMDVLDGIEATSTAIQQLPDRLSDSQLNKYEKLRHQHAQLVADFQTVLSLKEESVAERDALVKKVERLSSELSYLLNGDSRRVAEDLDGLLAENRYLKAQLNNAQEESQSIKATLAKYKAITEAKLSQQKKKGSGEPAAPPENSEEKSSVAVINMRQIREMLVSHAIELDDGDYRALVTVLLDLCNDKQMALAHQRRANKILAVRLSELESKLARIEAKSPRSSSPFLLNAASTVSS